MVIIIVRNIINFMLYINSTIGAIFCHVNTNKQFIQFRPSITSGNQKWNGAIPIFVSNAEFIIKVNMDLELVFLRIFVFIVMVIIEARIIVEAIA